MKSNGAKGLTMAEVMVALAVSSLLAAIGMSSLAKAREYGRRVQCLSNLHQISLSVLQYSSENRGQMPPFAYAPQPQPDGICYLAIQPRWSMASVGSGATKQLLVCPSDNKGTHINTTDPSDNPTSIPMSYGYNFTLFMQNTTMAKVNQGKTALVFDGDPSGAQASGTFNGVWWGAPLRAAGQTGLALICHNGFQVYVGVATVTNVPCQHAPHAPSGIPICYLGPCNGAQTYDVSMLNSQVLVRRHFNKANVVFVDGHGELLANLPSGSLFGQSSNPGMP